jgi:hypothetical protein
MSTIAHISLLQYEAMVEAGAFSGPQRKRIELIQGELRQMNPIGTWHASAVDLLDEWSHELAPKDQVRIRCQATLRIDVARAEGLLAETSGTGRCLSVDRSRRGFTSL